MTENINCFIPAAGFGERLRPITEHIPKPLVPMLGKPVLQRIIEKISAFSSGNIGINLHYKKETIEEWVKRSSFSERTVLFPEDPVLGTGGALKNAEAFLGSGTFLVHNSDIISDINIKDLLEFHKSSKNLVTLAVHDYPDFNNVAVSSDGILRGVGKKYVLKPGTERWMAFTGIAVYSPEFLNFLPEGISSVVDGWLKAADAGHSIGAFDTSGCYWSDIGTPVSYASTVLHLLHAQGESVYIHPSSTGCGDASLDGYLVIERGSKIDQGMSLRNCILLPGSVPEKGGHENCIIGPGFEINLEGPGESPAAEGNAVLIGTGGSDRKYFRMKKDNGTVVLMKAAPEDSDFQRHIEYTSFFMKYGVPVPELIGTDQGNMTAFFEDLGDTSLYNWLKCSRGEEQVEDMYRKVLDMLVLLHSGLSGHLSECPLLQERIFDYDHLRWETGYFLDRFVQGIRNITAENPSALLDEFHRLALLADSFPKTVIHRDFQSQNIMVTTNGVPRLIDYQGARIGPPAYDLVSMLWDPYFKLQDGTREDLLEYYVGRMSAASHSFDAEEFMASLLSCRLQRHMQALGAYGFLSKVKGKKYFLKHAAEGIKLLKDEVSLARDEYPELYNLVTGL